MPLARLAPVLLVPLCMSAGAQATTGELHLQVHDRLGAEVAAHGVLAGPVAGIRRQLQAASAGSFQVKGLQPGRYTLELQQPGFAVQRTSFSIASGEVLTQDVVLDVGSVNTTVDVIASTPIGSLSVPLADVPLPVQTLTSQTLGQTNAIDLTDAMTRRFNGVYVNENQNNPFQPDVNYRGYTASPLVGSPAGISVYLDGVRQNQPFGDVVQWDLIPKVAISTTELIPGSNPVYGLNTLGGAIAVQTKDGISNAGFRISGYGGAFGRRAVDAQYGRSAGAWNWFAAGTLFHEDGWRVQSPSSVRQSFAKLGYAHDGTVLSLSGGYSINNLTGNGTQDFRAIARTTGLNHGYSSVYSVPDTTWQHQPFVTLNVTHSLGTHVTVDLNSYIRQTRTNTTNGDVDDNSFDQSLYTLSTADKAALTSAGIAYPAGALNPANTPFPYLRCIAQTLEQAEPYEKCTGAATDTVNRQHALGLSGVLGWSGAHNTLAVGAGFDRGALTFRQAGQYGYLNADGISITRVPAFLDGTYTDDNGNTLDNRVNLHGTTTTPGVFLTDTLSTKRWVLTAGGRFNRTTINNTDRLPPVTYRGTLTAVNTFQRFNPTAGLVYKPGSVLNLYVNYGESSRAPTSTELGCADPDFPCSLPNALVSDPPLKQVVSRTIEFGVRGAPGVRLGWSAGYFHTNNYDDLLFVAAQVTGYGYFQNFGRTRRQGVEASVSTHRRTWDAGAEYTFLEATYQSAQTIEAGSNSSNSNVRNGEPGVTDGGLISITPGNHIPQVPQHLLKLYADLHPLRRLALSADLNLVGASYVRGNENNQHQPDGVYYLGRGTSPGYGVANLGGTYTISSHLEWFAQVNNLLNRHYYTAGQLATTPYDAAGNFVARPFAANPSGDYAVRNTTYLAPGAPITVFGGLRVTFGAR